MPNEKKDPGGGVGLQIDAPTPSTSPIPTMDKGQETTGLPNLPKPLTLEEKKFLLAVERGDLANVRRIIQKAHRKQDICVNCVDPLGRGALTLAIDGENLEMVELLIIMGVQTKDGLLQAINAEFVEAVELLLEHEEIIHVEGEPYSWQKVELNTAMFTPDITPLLLAAHRNNYEILKILLDRGATLPAPHDVKCGCDDCIRESTEDSLRHSLSRVNEYRALASPSLIALSSNDPLLTAFQLSWELRNLAFAEQECKAEYLELRRQCQQFAVDLLDQSRSSKELAIILNHDPNSLPYEDGDHMKLARLELAINFKQKTFVAHPNIQQLLASLWYEGVPGFRRKSAIQKLITIVTVAICFPFYCMVYMIAPNCKLGVLMRKPFMKFLVHASSYLLFLFVLILVSQRAEVHFIQLLGTESMKRALEEQLQRQRGNGPTILEALVVIWVFGFIWEETQEIFQEGIKEYLRNMWNFIDFSRNFLYVLVMLLRIVAYIQQTSEIKRDPSTAYIAREHWNDFDPQLIAEGLFAAANIFSALKLIHLFSINPHLGPLQISLGRMVIDIVKFFFIYSLVLFAFACGLNQLLWYFADLEKRKCYILPGEQPDWENQADACMKWRRFGNLFESSQSLFWASFGMVGLETFELTGIKSYTRFWGLLMFGSYSVINVIVLLNLLIAMMSNSYAMIDLHSDTEWKFARTKLWMSYFEESATLPPPFNIFPTVKMLLNLCKKKKSRKEIQRTSTIRRKEERDRDNRYTGVMRSLVWRYVAAMHRKMEMDAVTEDDINEVKGEISAMRYEFLEIFEKNGMDVSSADRKEKTVLAKRMKVWERRLMKDFQVAPTINDDAPEEDAEEIPEDENPVQRFRRVAFKVAQQTTSSKWDDVIEGVGCKTISQIGRCRNRKSFKNQQNLQKAMKEAKKFVEQKSPVQSRSISPIEINDPTNDTLMELLKNLTDENNIVRPDNMFNGRINPKSPMATLGKQLQSAGVDLVSLAKSPIFRNALTPTPISSINQNQSVGKQVPQTLSQKMNIETQSAGNSIPSPMSSTMPCSILKSPSKPVSILSTSTTPKSSRSSTPTQSVQDIPIYKPSTGVQSPPPIIQITRTESQLGKKDKSFDSSDSMDSTSASKKSITPSPTKIAKRESPPLIDISVSRPVAQKPISGQGMIPPPPVVEKTPPSTPPIVLAEIAKSFEPLKSPKHSTIVNIPPDDIKSSMESIISGSKEKLVSSTELSLDANKAACSPPCLRPIKKIEDVTTIKRVHKGAWL